ncbi:EAL domain-containing protein [Roseomonas nepalensis]|uniref:EAL domain-containing protein n=2 Tax=Muricoccus nepalensis TaxID=1854500 RepID=A0A502EMJ3_9PROT|nr:EAL domain-containing protein [Roseomonas nepalensis]
MNGGTPGDDRVPSPAVFKGGCGDCSSGLAAPFPFSMAFQPIVDVVAGRVHAYEALVRGPAGEPALTVLAQVTHANRYAFDQSCRVRAIELASRLGMVESGATLSINFIPGAMYRPENCVRATLAAARRHRFPLDRLQFEVTEGEKVDDPDHLTAIFREYRARGFRVAIDDFGAGYAGLGLLARFQPDVVKLDMELIRGLNDDRVRRSIVGAVLSVCAELNIAAVAEGVETRAELDALRDLGVRLVQGYLFARPAFEELPPISALA